MHRCVLQPPVWLGRRRKGVLVCGCGCGLWSRSWGTLGCACLLCLEEQVWGECVERKPQFGNNFCNFYIRNFFMIESVTGGLKTYISQGHLMLRKSIMEQN